MNNTHRAMTVRLLAGALALGLASGAFAQYPVGTRDITFYDPDRDRNIPTDLYYPAIAAGSNQAPADPPPNGFPAVAVGHGYQMSAGLYAWVANDLAANGFVVAAPRTGGETFPSHGAFGLDLAFVIRALKDAGDDPASPFFGRIAATSAVMGHSMGGGSSFLAAAGDTEITAVAGFAPAETNPSAIEACEQITRPVLIFAGSRDCVTPPAEHQIPMYAALPDGWRTLVTVTGASHCQWAAYSFLCSVGEWGCPSPTITRAQQQDLTLTLLRPWLQAVLLADGAAQLSFQDLLEQTPGITYEQEGQPVTAVPFTGPAAGIVLRAAGGNPFQGRLTLDLESARGGQANVEIFDVAGRRIRILPVTALKSGQATTLSWDGRDENGREQPAGVYLVRASAGQETTWLRVLRMR
jgi:pimeloyl-ACP methyl ester carboxylesterase